MLAVFVLVVTSSHLLALSSTTESSPEKTITADQTINIQLDGIKSLIKQKDYAAAEVIVNLLFDEVNEQKNSIKQIELYTLSGKLFYKQKQYDKAINQFEKGITFITAKDDQSKKTLAGLYHEIAQSYKHLQNIPKSIENYEKGLKIQKERKDNFFIATALKNIAMAENKQQNYMRALEFAQKSLAILASGKWPLRHAQVLLNTGIIYRNIGHYEKSLDYIQQAKAIYEQEDDIQHLAEVDNQIGLIYTSLHQLNNAKSFYQQTLDLPIESVKSETRAAAFRELGVISHHQGKIIESNNMLIMAQNIYESINKISKTTRVELLLGRNYLEQNKLDIATGYFEESLALATDFEQVDFQIQSLNLLGEIMFNKDINQAISLFEQALTLSSEIDDKNEKMKSYYWLKEIEKRRGNLEKSLEYSEKRYQLSLAIQQERENLDFTKNQVILASYKLEMELKGLRESSELNTLKLIKQQNELSIMKQLQQISELEIKKNRFANWLLITLLLVFSLLALYILYQYRNTRAKNKELDYLASRDPLTNCFNRRILYLRFNKSLEQQETLQQYSVILADIDSFKAINDTYGHTTGDQVIRGVANILQNNSSEHDTVARFGGEEFCILLPNTKQEDAEKIAEKMRLEIENSRYESVKVTCSFGIASLNHQVESNLTLIERADMALYQSKYQGRNQVSVWEPQDIDSKES